MIFDPSSAPIIEVSSEPCIDPQHLSMTWLRTAFANPKTWQIEPIDTQNSSLVLNTFIPAAVLVPLIIRECQLTVLLTRRTDHLHDHAGQISFPGGRAESQDQSLQETALRETQEETGLMPHHIEVLGQLPNYLSVTGYTITPIVGLIQSPFNLQLDPFEVAEIFEVPLDFLMNPVNHQVRRFQLKEKSRHFYSMPYGNHLIWGATAAILRNLYRFLIAQTSSTPPKS